MGKTANTRRYKHGQMWVGSLAGLAVGLLSYLFSERQRGSSMVELGQATPDSHSTAQEKLVSFKAAAGEAASFQSRQGAGQGCERGLVSSPRIPAGTAGVRGDQTLSSLKRKEGG